MRIIGGERRGRRLKSPPFGRVRPTADRVREAVFNVLGPLVRDRTVFDLFAGSGALGLEALSRGAAFAVFIERDRRVLSVLRANVRALQYEDRSCILGQDVFREAPKWIGRGEKELIFADPPYRRGYVEPLLAMLEPRVAEDAWIVIEHASDESSEIPSSTGRLRCVDRRRYGDTAISAIGPPDRGGQAMATVAYPGSFDPITNGHLDIIQRAAALFERVAVAVFTNPGKTPVFSQQERQQMVREATSHLDNVVVESAAGLLVDFCRDRGIRVVIKGLRAVSDFDYEFQMALMNRELNEGIETLFMVTSPEHLFLSSSIVREIAGFGGDVEPFVPPAVAKQVRKRFSGRRM